jgi:hypothetical protein
VNDRSYETCRSTVGASYDRFTFKTWQSARCDGDHASSDRSAAESTGACGQKLTDRLKGRQSRV